MKERTEGFVGVFKIVKKIKGVFMMVEKEKKDSQHKYVNGVYDEEGDVVSVYDAALIYQANDYNENYMFGYTHEQLMDALD